MEFLDATGNGTLQRLSAWHRETAAALFIACCFLFPAVRSSQVKPTRRILIIYESSPSSPLPNLIDHGVQAALDNSPYLIEFHREYMETASFPEAADQQMIRDYYIRKYQNLRLDVVIAVGPSPLLFMLEAHKKSFAGVPVIFCLPNRPSGDLTVDSDFTGVEGDLAPAQTLAAALRLQPGTTHVVVVSGTSPFDRQQNAAVKDQLKIYEGRLDISYLSDLAMPDLLERLRQLPSHTLVVLGALGRDAAGRRFTLAESGPMVVAAANAPVFSLNDRALNHGEVGGDVSNSIEQGRIVGHMALRMFNGEKPRDIPTVTNGTTYMFDSLALKRWGMKESALPPGSVVLNRQPGFWELYKQYVLAGVFVFLAQTAAILGLLRQRKQRRKTEAELRKSEEKFSKSFRESPLAIGIASTNDDHYLEVNETFESLTGWKRGEVVGRSPRGIKLWVDLDQRVAFVKQLLEQGSVRDLEVRLRRKDGQIRTTLGSAELIDVEGEPCALSVFTDITERKQAEEALASVSRRLIEAQEQERTRIARELHDDINQRLAMLAVNLQMLKQELPASALKTSDRFEQVFQYVSDLGIDVQALSHRLHSSKLEYLGLQVASASFCRELSEQQGVEINFHTNGVPETLASEISLSLFRVLQEALHNALKYSGVQEFEVSLASTSNELQLVIRDSGIGFSLDNASRGDGLGLISMKERMKLVNGTLSIDSKPRHGTTVLACVPLSESGIDSAGAVA